MQGTASRIWSTAIVLASLLGAGPISSALGESGFGLGNWGGSSVSVGRSTFYANGLVANQVGNTSFFNNGLVGRQYGRLTLYNNGLVAARGRTNTYYSNLAVGVPVRQGTGPGLMVYGGGYPYPQGPGPFPFGRPPTPVSGMTPWSVQPWSQTPWQRP